MTLVRWNLFRDQMERASNVFKSLIIVVVYICLYDSMCIKATCHLAEHVPPYFEFPSCTFSLLIKVNLCVDMCMSLSSFHRVCLSVCNNHFKKNLLNRIEESVANKMTLSLTKSTQFHAAQDLEIFVKAYDAVNPEILWRILPILGVPESLIEVLKKLYKDVTINLRVGEKLEQFLSTLDKWSQRKGQ
jgi:hypothetical protein